MSTSQLSSGIAWLAVAAEKHFKSVFQIGQIQIATQVQSNLNWIPTLHFKVHDHLTIFAEVSEIPYPAIVGLRRVDIQQLDQPVAIFVVCPEESYLKHQSDAKRLINDGYGLITVSADGSVQTRAECIPVIQQITKVEFSGDIQSLPRKVRTHLAEAYQCYGHNAPQGTAKVAEVFEGLVLKAARDAANRGWIAKSDVNPASPANTLQAMSAAKQLKSAAAAIAASQAFISMYRNTSHHFPKNAKQAAKKYRDCRHGFLEGLKKITFFRDAMKAAGLSGGI